MTESEKSDGQRVASAVKASCQAVFQRLASGLTSRVQWLVCLVLAVLCVLAAVKLTALMVTGPALPGIKFPPVQSSPRLAGADLYPAAGSAMPAGETLSEAAIDASLSGVIYLPDRALASIAVGNGREKVYRAGDELVAGATLERIEASRVVISERGVLRQLTLKSLLDSQPPIEVNESLVPDSGLPPVVASPVLGDNGISGLRVDQLEPELEALDLVRRGDVVVAVDGVGLQSLMADPVAMGRLAEREVLTLTVLRDGSETTVDIDGEIIQTMMNQF